MTLAQGCALVAGLDEFGPRGGGGASTSTVGGGASAGEGGTGGDGAATSSSTGGSPCANDLIITEVRTKGPVGPADELVEIFNPTNVQVDLSTIQIHGKPLASTTFNVKWSGAAIMIEPMGRRVVGGPTYSEDPPPDFVLSQSFSDDQVIALVRVDGADTIEVDRIALCCDECGDFPGVALNPACGKMPDSNLCLHREPACVDGALVAGEPTPLEGAP